MRKMCATVRECRSKGGLKKQEKKVESLKEILQASLEDSSLPHDRKLIFVMRESLRLNGVTKYR